MEDRGEGGSPIEGAPVAVTGAPLCVFSSTFARGLFRRGRPLVVGHEPRTRASGAAL